MLPRRTDPPPDQCILFIRQYLIIGHPEWMSPAGVYDL